MLQILIEGNGGTHVGPDGGGVVDGDGPGGEFGGISINGHEARVETTGFGNTGVVEARLGNGVVLLVAVKRLLSSVSNI